MSELKASKRDPEFQFYDQTEAKLFAYKFAICYYLIFHYLRNASFVLTKLFETGLTMHVLS